MNIPLHQFLLHANGLVLVQELDLLSVLALVLDLVLVNILIMAMELVLVLDLVIVLIWFWLMFFGISSGFDLCTTASRLLVLVLVGCSDSLF